MESMTHCPNWVVQVLEYLQTASDLVGMAIISLGFIFASFRWIKLEFRSMGQFNSNRWSHMKQVRMLVGHYILMGLEFMIVSDIIHSFLKPNLESLYELAGIVVIRTGIGFFLGKELESLESNTESTVPKVT